MLYGGTGTGTVELYCNTSRFTCNYNESSGRRDVPVPGLMSPNPTVANKGRWKHLPAPASASTDDGKIVFIGGKRYLKRKRLSLSSQQQACQPTMPRSLSSPQWISRLSPPAGCPLSKLLVGSTVVNTVLVVPSSGGLSMMKKGVISLLVLSSPYDAIIGLDNRSAATSAFQQLVDTLRAAKAQRNLSQEQRAGSVNLAYFSISQLRKKYAHVNKFNGKNTEKCEMNF